MTDTLITIAVPSLNQGNYLEAALKSIFMQEIPVEVHVLDGGSTDNSVEIIKKWESQITWWRSEPDAGQAAAINEGIQKGKAPYVCWLNADDQFLPNGLTTLWKALEESPAYPAAYGRCWTLNQKGNKILPYVTTPFWPRLFVNFCFICQPATLIRREAWESVGGLDENLHMALDYDLWWRLYRKHGKLQYVRKFVAGTIMHQETKTAIQRKEHYRESMEVVLRHTGRVPLKWYMAWPFMVNLRASLRELKSKAQHKP